MSLTVVEKLFRRYSDNPECRVGDTVNVTPEHIFLYDFKGFSNKLFAELDSLGGRLEGGAKTTVFIDHHCPVANLAEEQTHVTTRAWVERHGGRLIEGRGIGHQVTAEHGLAGPGELVVHFDGHVNTIGAIGALGLAVGSDIRLPIALNSFWFTVPATTLIRLTGSLAHGVMARDLFMHTLYDLGPSGCSDQVIQYAGAGAGSLSIDQRMTMCNQAMFLGAQSALFVSDDVALEYAARASNGRTFSPVFDDPGCEYAAVHEYDLSAVEPYVAAPHDPSNIVPLREAAGVAVQHGYIGSCAGGRIEDLAAATEILRGRKLATGTTLHVVPTSNEIFKEATDRGYLSALKAAGATITPPSCDFCFGSAGAMAPRQVAVSTGTLNVAGRMGAPDGEIYLSSAATVAASLLEGRLTDPRPYLTQGAPNA